MDKSYWTKEAIEKRDNERKAYYQSRVVALNDVIQKHYSIIENAKDSIQNYNVAIAKIK